MDYPGVTKDIFFQTVYNKKIYKVSLVFPFISIFTNLIILCSVEVMFLKSDTTIFLQTVYTVPVTPSTDTKSNTVAAITLHVR